MHDIVVIAATTGHVAAAATAAVAAFRGLELCGLAWDVRRPTEEQKQRVRAV